VPLHPFTLEASMLRPFRFARALIPVTVVVTSAVLLVAQDAPQGPKPGFGDPVLGRWDLTVKGVKAAYPSWVEIHMRKETQLQGRFVGESGSVRYLTRVDYGDGTLEFTVAPQYEKQQTDLVFTGRLNGDRLEGTTRAPDGTTLNWTGVRAPTLLRDAAPAWGAPVDLFDGQTTAGWRQRSPQTGDCWQVSGGLLTNGPKCTDLITERAFSDFKLHAEFTYPRGSNSGIYLRGRYEVQIQDDAGKVTDALRMGGLYGFLRPYADAAHKAGEQQAYDITLIGRRITIVLNGKTIVDNEAIPGITGGALDSNEGDPGPIMLQGDHGPISFRKVVITPAS
jgi:hypothetical protein